MRELNRISCISKSTLYNVIFLDSFISFFILQDVVTVTVTSVTGFVTDITPCHVIVIVMIVI